MLRFKVRFSIGLRIQFGDQFRNQLRILALEFETRAINKIYTSNIELHNRSLGACSVVLGQP